MASLALGPVLYLQGRRVRRSLPRLPEPPGAREGESGNGSRLRLLVLGDSAAAGVGAAHQDVALLGRLVHMLAHRYTVDWVLRAKTGATTASTLELIRGWEPRHFDVAVTSLGVNDITAGLGRSAWRRQQADLRDVLRSSCGVDGIVACGLPPVHGFPALPQPLRWYLGERARAFDSDLQRDVAEETDVSFLSLRFTEDAGLMASDGFHPGPGVFREWGRRAADAVSSLAEARRARPV